MGDKRINTVIQWGFPALVVLVNVLLWAIPSDVVDLVARDNQTLLGRYGRTHFAWNLALIPVSAVALYIHFSPNAAAKKRKGFRVAAVLLVLVPATLALDVYLRLTQEYSYVLDGLAYRRTPGQTYTGAYDDVPETHRTYPEAPPGFGRVPWTLTIDERGYRNPTCLDHYDVVALGDSFTGGSRVDDAQAWPVRFTERTGIPVYNLGMSGYAPQNCLAALKEKGLRLKPKYVFWLICEGNDFRQAKVTDKAPPEWSRFFKRSPLVRLLDQFLIRTLGPIGARRHLDGLEMLSWMPVACPPGPNARYYAFPPSFLVHHYVSREEFEDGKHWKRTRANLEAMLAACKQAQAKLVIFYAPTKPHVVLPLVKDTLPADKVRAFTALQAKKELPEPAVFLRNLFEYLDVQEAVVAQWCREQHVPFVSLTQPLRDAVAAGRQPYYTYNDHWSPVGHEVAGTVAAEFWQSLQKSPADYSRAPDANEPAANAVPDSPTAGTP